MTEPARRFPVRSLLIAAAFWAAGMGLAHGPMIASGLRSVQGNLGAPRWLHYTLEHDHRWMTGDPHHRSYWDPPLFHPVPNIAAYSETMLGTAPLYSAWRLLGAPMDLAYPLWILSVSTLNFVAAFLFLRHAMNRSDPASGFGAFLFSFASTRLAYIGLTQLLPGFYLVLAIHGLVLMFRQDDWKRALRWTTLFSTALVGQAYACFYVAWFLVLALGIAALWSLALPTLRPLALPALKRHAVGLASAVVVAGLALLPFIVHALRVAREVGYREYDEIEMYLPRVQSWVYFGSDHWLYGWSSGLGLFQGIPTRNSEHMIGFGLVSTVLAVLGLIRLRPTPLGRLFGATAASLIALTLLLPGGMSCWALVFLTVPGAQALRAVARVSVLLLLPASAGAAAWFDLSGWKRPLLALLAFAALLEQGRRSPSYDRIADRDAIAALARRVDPAAEAFFYSVDVEPAAESFNDVLPRLHVDAMMISLVSGVPTINGYTGSNPRGWPFEALILTPPGDREARTEEALQAWCREKGLDRRRIQWLKGGR